jgi:exodeoxyribonuclease VII small subunit
MATEKKRKGSFEETLRRLEQIVEQLEKGEVPLEDALILYEEGIKLSKTCGERLNQAELTLKRLGRDVEGNLKLFSTGDEE